MDSRFEQTKKRSTYGRHAAVTCAFCVLLCGCGSRNQLSFQSADGLHFTPPEGWVERMRGDVAPPNVAIKRNEVPLPPIDTSGKTVRERLLVRYDRLTSSEHAWLRLSVAEAPASVTTQAFVATKLPAASWKRESVSEDFEVAGMPAARIACRGKWNGDEFINESVAVRRDAKIYLISATFPAHDNDAREQVRQAVARTKWQ
jgi:hypothetical protein